jgi:hypothetical protein
MPATSWPTRSKTSCPPTRSVRASAAKRPLLISAFLILAGCQSTDVVARSAYEPDSPAPDAIEFDRSSKILFKRCIVAFGEDRWEGVTSDAKKLQATAKKWSQQKGVSAEQKPALDKLMSGSLHLEEAGTKADAKAVSTALGEVADALAKLHVAAPPAVPAKKE